MTQTHHFRMKMELAHPHPVLQVAHRVLVEAPQVVLQEVVARLHRVHRPQEVVAAPLGQVVVRHLEAHPLVLRGAVLVALVHGVVHQAVQVVQALLRYLRALVLQGLAHRRVLVTVPLQVLAAVRAQVHRVAHRLRPAVLALVVVAVVALLLVALALLVVLTHLVLAAVTLALLLQEAAVHALLRAPRRLGRALVRAVRVVRAQVAEAVVVHRQVR